LHNTQKELTTSFQNRKISKHGDEDVFMNCIQKKGYVMFFRNKKTYTQTEDNYEMQAVPTSICNISTEGAALRKAVVHKRSNSTKAPSMDNFFSLLNAEVSCLISGCSQIW
jgi:hypothetical protein